MFLRFSFFQTFPNEKLLNNRFSNQLLCILTQFWYVKKIHTYSSIRPQSDFRTDSAKNPLVFAMNLQHHENGFILPCSCCCCTSSKKMSKFQTVFSCTGRKSQKFLGATKIFRRVPPFFLRGGGYSKYTNTVSDLSTLEFWISSKIYWGIY